MRIDFINLVLKVLPLFLVLCIGCNNDDQNVEISDELKEIMEHGVTVDSIGIDYAKINISEDGYPIIEPISVDRFIDKEEAIIYFEVFSNSLDLLYEYYRKRDEEYLGQGLIVEWYTKYFDQLEDISIEVMKNDNEFYEVHADSVVLKFIPTPELTSGFTFARLEMTKEEFIDGYDGSFPKSFILLFNDNDLKSNTFVFRTTFWLNDNRQFILNTDQIKF